MQLFKIYILTKTLAFDSSKLLPGLAQGQLPLGKCLVTLTSTSN